MVTHKLYNTMTYKEDMRFQGRLSLWDCQGGGISKLAIEGKKKKNLFGGQVLTWWMYNQAKVFIQLAIQNRLQFYHDSNSKEEGLLTGLI